MVLITFLMPTLNEEEGIEATIRTIPLRKLQQAGYRVEVLVVDGGSTDKTVTLAQKAGARVIKSERGYGKQYQFGLKRAKGEIIITGDSDGTYPFEDALRYIKIFETRNLDFVTINRFAHLEKNAMSPLTQIGNLGLTFWTFLLFGLPIRDSQSGMWIIRKTILKQILGHSSGMSFSQELKINAFRRVRSAELPGRYKIRLGETKLLKWKEGWGNLKHLFSMRIKSNR